MLAADQKEGDATSAVATSSSPLMAVCLYDFKTDDAAKLPLKKGVVLLSPRLARRLRLALVASLALVVLKWADSVLASWEQGTRWRW
jgi:hypothetical protein